MMHAWMGQALVDTVRSAERVGLLAALEQPMTAEALARALSLSERAVRLSLPVLAAIGWVEETDGVFRRPSDEEALREAWPGLEAFLRSGRVPEHIDRVELRGAYYASAVLGLAAAFAPHARRLADELRPVDLVADVGAGSAVWSLAMAARTARTRVIAIDRPEVLPRARTFARSMGLEGQLGLVEGDYFTAELGEPVDRVVLANVLHLEDGEGAAALIRRYASMLAPGGEIVVVDHFRRDGFDERLVGAAYDLHLGMRTTKGRAHDIAHLRRWCEEAGLGAQQVLPLGLGALGALVCSRRPVESGRAVASVPTATDDVEILRAERDAFEARFHMMVDGAADAMMFVDKEARWVGRTNAAFAALLGVDWAVYEPHSLDEIVAVDDLERCRGIILGLAAGRITERRHRVQLLRGGVSFTAELTAFDPHPRSVIGVMVRDADRIAREEKLQALGELVGGLLHDLNTPLGSLKANCDSTHRLAGRLASGEPVPARQLDLLLALTADAVRAAEDIASKLVSLEAFATLEGAALKSLAPHFRSGLARAVCDRVAGEARGSSGEGGRDGPLGGRVR